MVCSWCGEGFTPANGKAMFCGAKCRYAARDRRRHVERGTTRTATCKRCGDEFAYESTTKPRLYCFGCSPEREAA